VRDITVRIDVYLERAEEQLNEGEHCVLGSFIICAFHKISTIMRWQCLVACVGEMKYAYNFFVGKPEVRNPYGRPSRR
jgi:hypothetical protein